MPATATPKQGDHVFNAVDTAILRPFETIRSLRTHHLDGQHFLHDYLLHSYSMARKFADTPALIPSRKLAASAGAEEDALREIRSLRPRYAALAPVSPGLLREVHLRNAEQFGSAATRFEVEMLKTIQQALEAAVAPANAKSPAGWTPSPGIACQQMLAAAYDPAAALVVVVSSMARELPAVQSTFHGVIAGIAETLDRPAMWKDPYTRFRQDRPSATGSILSGIRDVLLAMDLLKAQTSVFAALVKQEIVRKTQAPQTDAPFGAMLHLLHARLQQMRGSEA